MPIMRARFSSDCVKISGQRKSFQILAAERALLDGDAGRLRERLQSEVAGELVAGL
jgi:hypothetical protein